MAEYQARSTRGVKVLVSGVVAVLAGVALGLYSGNQTGATKTALIWAGIFVVAIAVTLLAATPVTPGQARVIQLFGKYRGTVREPGMRWVNPFTLKRGKVSTELRNHETAVSKVNDADGNPIEIAAMIMWQVADTAKALYAVVTSPTFSPSRPRPQSGPSLPATPMTPAAAASCRCGTTGRVTQRLSAEIAGPGRLASVHDRRIPAYPAVVRAGDAQAMLRQQQASAVIGAGRSIVEGAVGMVKLALRRLQEEGVVELDEERKAAMVSNLLWCCAASGRRRRSSRRARLPVRVR